MWSKDQITKFRRALANAKSHEETLAKLAEIAKHSPEFAEAVRDLQTRREYVETMSKVCLEVAEPEQPTRQ